MCFFGFHCHIFVCMFSCLSCFYLSYTLPICGLFYLVLLASTLSRYSLFCADGTLNPFHSLTHSLTWRYWWLCPIDFHNFFIVYVFEVKKFISDILTELPCSGDLENLGQLPVQEVLRGTDDCVLWIFIISSVFMFSRSRNPFLTFLLSYHVWVTSKIQVNLRFSRYWWFCLINFWNFFTIHVFKVKESIVDIPTELPCLVDSENLGQLPVRELPKGTDDRFLWIFTILHYLCFHGQGIICWHFYWATMFGGPRKSRTTSCSRGFEGHPCNVAP